MYRMLFVNMRHTELKKYLTEQYEYPIKHKNLIQKLGDKKVIAQNGQTEEIQNILQYSQTTEYRSVDDLYRVFLGYLTEDFIAQKNYDDRSPNHPELDDQIQIQHF